jgi:hypothetical protein
MKYKLVEIMAKNFAEIGFSSAAKKLQEKHGSRATYSRMESKQLHRLG